MHCTNTIPEGWVALLQRCTEWAARGEMHTTDRISVRVMCSRSCPQANAGDSRAVICVKGQATPLSYDHKPTNEGTDLRRAGFGPRHSAFCARAQCFGQCLFPTHFYVSGFVRCPYSSPLLSTDTRGARSESDAYPNIVADTIFASLLSPPHGQTLPLTTIFHLSPSPRHTRTPAQRRQGGSWLRGGLCSSGASTGTLRSRGLWATLSSRTTSSCRPRSRL